MVEISQESLAEESSESTTSLLGRIIESYGDEDDVSYFDEVGTSSSGESIFIDMDMQAI
jgi:hypothetical protein